MFSTANNMNIMARGRTFGRRWRHIACPLVILTMVSWLCIYGYTNMTSTAKGRSHVTPHLKSNVRSGGQSIRGSRFGEQSSDNKKRGFKLPSPKEIQQLQKPKWDQSIVNFPGSPRREENDRDTNLPAPPVGRRGYSPNNRKNGIRRGNQLNDIPGNIRQRGVSRSKLAAKLSRKMEDSESLTKPLQKDFIKKSPWQPGSVIKRPINTMEFRGKGPVDGVIKKDARPYLSENQVDKNYVPSIRDAPDRVKIPANKIQNGGVMSKYSPNIAGASSSRSYSRVTGPPRPRVRQTDTCSTHKWPYTLGMTDTQTFLRVSDLKQVFVFSAFADDRPKLGQRVVRIIAAGLQPAYNPIRPMYCLFWKSNGNNLRSYDGGAATYKTVYHSTAWPSMYTVHFLTCEVPKNVIFPLAVSVVPRRCEKPVHAIPIKSLSPPNGHFRFNNALCVSPLYGDIDVATLAEFIEVHSLLGVQSFTFYNHSVSKDVDKLLRYYQERGKVKVVQWNFPQGVDQSYFMQRVALNDCIYKYMSEALYVGVYDLDEVAVPRETNTWTELLDKLRISNPDLGVFMFQHVYFRRNTTVKSKYNFITQRSFWRTKDPFPPEKIRCKSVYIAERALEVDIHFPYKLLGNHSEYLVAPSDGLLHHYRPAPMESFRKPSNKFEFIEDRRLSSIRTELEKRYAQVMSAYNRS